MAHVDGADQESGITPLLARIQEVSQHSQTYPNGRIELHLVGGYMDPRGYSERLVNSLLRKPHYSSFNRILKLIRSLASLIYYCQFNFVSRCLSQRACGN